MLIFGHNLLQTPSFFYQNEVLGGDFGDENSVLCLHYDEGLIQKAKNDHLNLGVLVRRADEIFLGNALGASFLLFEDEKLAKFAAKAAEFYLFDAKILLIVSSLKNLKKAYKIGIDGVILRGFIQNLPRNFTAP